MNPLVSVIVPVYRAEEYFDECVQSIMDQTYENLEIILVDDGSPDNSGKMCDEYAQKDKRVIVIHKENGGVSSARNCGLDNAKGDYITFVDSDDFIENTYVDKLLKCCVENNADMSFCAMGRYNGEEFLAIKEFLPQYVDISGSNNKAERANLFERFLTLDQSCIFGSCCRILYKKQIVENIRFNANIKISEDLVFVLNALLTVTTIASESECLYWYRVNDVSATCSYKKNYLASQIELLHELEKIYSHVNAESALKGYFCLLCYWCFSNEIKFKNEGKHQNIRAIRKSKLYGYFKLKNILCAKHSIKTRVKELIVFALVKSRIV